MRALAFLPVITLAIVLCPGAMGSDARPPAQPAGVALPPSQSVTTQAAREPLQIGSLGFEWASVFQPGAQVAPGDYTRTIRPFLDWTQICDTVQGGRRLCYLETVAREAGTMLSWRIAMTKDGRSMALVILPPGSNSDDGATVEFGGLARVAKPLTCDKLVCVATFPVDGPTVGLLARELSATISFRWGAQPLKLTVGLRGMGQALADLMPRPEAAQRQATPRVAARNAAPKQANANPAKAAGSPWETMR